MNAEGSNNPDKDFSEIRIKVIPRSSREEITGRENDVYKVRLTSPPVDGEANKALISFLSKKMQRPKWSIEITAGRKSRIKTVRIYGLLKEEIKKLLE